MRGGGLIEFNMIVTLPAGLERWTEGGGWGGHVGSTIAERRGSSEGEWHCDRGRLAMPLGKGVA